MALNIFQQNIHWSQPYHSGFTKFRILFEQLKSSIDQKLMSFIIGPRRVGKSVIMRQLIDFLLNHQSVKPRQILFWEFSPKDSKDILNDILQEFIYKITDKNQIFYIFLDEIQYVKNWESEIKLIYDQFSQVRFVLTGSLSLSYKRKMDESLAGRFLPYYLYPLNFREYLNFTDHPLESKFISKLDSFDQKSLSLSLNSDFQQFLKFGRYPETLRMPDSEAKYYLSSLQFQCLNQDTLTYFNLEKLNLLQSLFNYFKSYNGAETSFAKLSQIIGGNQETISKYVDVLELLRLIYIVPNTSNPLKLSNSNKKIYTNSAFSLNSDFSSQLNNLGQIAESYALEQLLQTNQTITFYRNRNKEIDFIAWNKQNPDKNGQAYEVKYRQKIDSNDYKNLENLSNELNLSPVLLTLNENEIPNQNILAQPLCLFEPRV